MEQIDFTNVKKVLLVGAGGKTGFWYARLLIRDGIDVYAYDQNENAIYDDDLLAGERFHRVTPAEFNDAGILEKVDSVTLSPGVPLKQTIFEKARDQGKFIFSELEYGYQQLSDRRWVCVTGTDGKSTTVALIEHGLNAFGKPAISCGNYGLSFSQIAFENDAFSKYEYLVAELSSYQLELCRNLQSEVAVYLNLAPDHLNRYNDVEEYGRVKYHIASTVKSNGLFVVNKNLLPGFSKFWKINHPLENLSKTVTVVSVDTQNLESENFQVANGHINEKKSHEQIIDLPGLNIHGEHNYTNVLFTLETLRYFGCVDKTLARKALSTFQSLPHRYEQIFAGRDGDKNIYINDSKATTTQAAAIAIKNSKAPLFLFMGGRSKGEDYGEIASIIKNTQAHVFLYGENRRELNEVFSRQTVDVVSVKETLEIAFADAQKYQTRRDISEATYLLSPASTSWDQYSSFEERGEHFRKLVHSI